MKKLNTKKMIWIIQRISTIAMAIMLAVLVVATITSFLAVGIKFLEFHTVLNASKRLFQTVGIMAIVSGIFITLDFLIKKAIKK